MIKVSWGRPDPAAWLPGHCGCRGAASGGRPSGGQSIAIHIDYRELVLIDRPAATLTLLVAADD
ncbi:hypothetical protein ACGFY7_03400 [Streptomyces prunicolor]|uniref:hypothetical protein n=1 Tax=Streptomyces prunicolor TaxID=67348 RepID=UPI00372477FB